MARRHSELFRAAAHEVRLLLRMSREARIEADARLLVQKLAREAAANHAANCARLERGRLLIGSPEYMEVQNRLPSLDRRVRNARTLRDIALVGLRRELGLPDVPTQAELADWGEAP
jgi:hypothetical protein